MSLRMQLLLLQVVIVLATVSATGVASMLLQERQLRDGYQDRMVAVAQSTARLPSIVDAFRQPDPSATIQPIAEVIRKASDVTYVVVANVEGIRYSHPTPELIGQRVSTDPSVPLSGHVYTGTQTGTLGESWRVKVPVFDEAGRVIGQVSVGILEADLRSDFLGSLWGLSATLVAAAGIGVLGSALISRLIRRRIYGLEPDQIRTLLETREAMLHGIREGLIAVDDAGRIVLLNDAAARLLGVEADELLGRDAPEVLDQELALYIASGRRGEALVLVGEQMLLVHSDRVSVDGRSIGSIVILRDRTELESVLRDLAGAQSLADGLRAQAHEFSNTLHVVSGLLEFGMVDAAIDFIDRLGKGGAISVLDEDDGIGDVELSALLLAKRSRAHELGITLRVTPDSQIGARPVPGNEVLTVVGNLIDNALEASSAGGTILVTIVQDEAAGTIDITVDDDGPGIPPELQHTLFEAGVTTTDAAEVRRGIGLTLVSRVARRLHGSATAGASERGGARMHVRLSTRPALAAAGEGATR